MMEYRERFRTTEEIFLMVQKALADRQPFSLIRIGDGEARVLAHDSLFPLTKIPRVKLNRIKYAGVDLPNPHLSKEMIDHIKEADVVGLSSVEGPGAYPLIRRILASPKIPLDLSDLKVICNAYIHLDLLRKGLWNQLWQGQRLLLIGRRAKEAFVRVEFPGAHVLGWCDFEGYSDMEHCLTSLRSIKGFNLVLVSAGIPSIILVPQIAQEFGVVAFDFGHLMDYLLDPHLKLGEIRISAKKKWERKEELGRDDDEH